MPTKNSTASSNPLSAMFRHGLSIARTRSPTPSKKSQKSEAGRETPPIGVQHPSADERVFRGIKPSASISPSSTASSMSSRSVGARSVGTSSYLSSSPRSETASMGFGRQSRKRMGHTGALKTPPRLRVSRSTSSLAYLVPSPTPSKTTRRDDDLVSFLDFDSDGSDDEGQDLLISASVSSASSSQGALTPSDSGSLLSDSDGSALVRLSEEYAISKVEDDADHIIDAISLHLRLDEPETSDQLLRPSSGKMFTGLVNPNTRLSSHRNYTLNRPSAESSPVKTEYISPSTSSTLPLASPASTSAPSVFGHPTSSSIIIPSAPHVPSNGLDIALSEEDRGGSLPLTFSSLAIPFGDSRRPSEVSVASASSAASDLTIDASTGVARRKSSVYDSNYFETVVSPTLDLFPSPPPSNSSTPASTPSKPSPLTPVEEENDVPSTPTTPTPTAGSPSIETLLGISSKRLPTRRPRTPPPPRPPAAQPPPPVPSLPLLDDSPSRVILSAEAPARPRRAAPPAPLRFGANTKFQPPTRNGALRRAPSILSPTASSELSSPEPAEGREATPSPPSSISEYAGGDFFESYTPEFEVVMKVGGLEDINEEDDDEMGSPFFSACSISPDTMAREDRMWAEVAKGIRASVHAAELLPSAMPNPA